MPGPNAFHGHMTVAALKPQSPPALVRHGRPFPRSHDRGRIEAEGQQLGLLSERSFPRSHDRGRIEASITQPLIANPDGLSTVT